MTITLRIPPDLEPALRRALGDDLGHAAAEALACEGYRTAKLSLGEVARILGIGVVEALDWLGRRGIPLNYDLEELEADRLALARLDPNGG